jgi:hypothetical protein
MNFHLIYRLFLIKIVELVNILVLIINVLIALKTNIYF